MKKRGQGSEECGAQAPHSSEQKEEFHSAEGLCLKKFLVHSNKSNGFGMTEQEREFRSSEGLLLKKNLAHFKQINWIWYKAMLRFWNLKR